MFTRKDESPRIQEEHVFWDGIFREDPASVC